MSKPANWTICADLEDRLVLMDLGPWDKHLSITNDAEHVVEQVAPLLRGRRLFYYDSEGQADELLVADGKFAGFNVGPGSR